MCTKYWQSSKIKVLFELMLKSQSTSKVMSGRCLHFMGLLPNMMMTYNNCLKYNHPAKPQKLYKYGWFDMNHFSWAGSDQSG